MESESLQMESESPLGVSLCGDTGLESALEAVELSAEGENRAGGLVVPQRRSSRARHPNRYLSLALRPAAAAAPAALPGGSDQHPERTEQEAQQLASPASVRPACTRPALASLCLEPLTHRALCFAAGRRCPRRVPPVRPAGRGGGARAGLCGRPGRHECAAPGLQAEPRQRGQEDSGCQFFGPGQGSCGGGGGTSGLVVYSRAGALETQEAAYIVWL